MSERCPLLDAHSNPITPSRDKYGAVWDSGLPNLCMEICFGAGQARAERQGAIVTEKLASEEEISLAEGDTGMSEGILANNRIDRLGYIDINDGTDPEAILLSSQFSFICDVESKS